MKTTVLRHREDSWGWIKEDYPDILYYYFGKFVEEDLQTWFFIQFKKRTWDGKTELRIYFPKIFLEKFEDLHAFQALVEEAKLIYRQIELTRPVD